MKKYLLGVFLLLAIVVTPAPVKAATVEELQAMIAQLRAQIAIAQLEAQLAALRGGENCPTFNQDLSIGDGELGDGLAPEVKRLQKYLISQHYLASNLATGYFGKITESALKQWQSANGVSVTGLFEKTTRVMMWNFCDSSVGDYKNVTPSITVLSPNGGERWRIGNTYQFRWSSSNTNSMSINLDNLDTGSRYTLPTTIDPGSGAISWTVRDINLSPGRYKAFVTAMNGNLASYDSSNAPFTISSSPTPVVTPISYSAPAFNYNAGSASHRLYLNFNNYGKIISITPETNNANCFDFGLTITNRCTVKSYAGGSSCGIYLQRNPASSGRCIVKVVYQEGNSTATKYFESSGTVNVETIGEISITDLNNSDATVNVQQAKNTLINYLNYLASGEYDKVSNLYATDYTALRSWNPGVNQANHSELFKRGCEINGLECLKLKEIVKTEVDGNRVILTVKLVDPVSLSGTYCAKGADLASACLSEFKMTVVNLGDDIGYRVVDLP